MALKIDLTFPKLAEESEAELVQKVNIAYQGEAIIGKGDRNVHKIFYMSILNMKTSGE